MNDPNEVQIAPNRQAFEGLVVDETAGAYTEPFVSTFRELINQPGIRRVIYQSEPHDRSIFDALTHVAVELPRTPRHIQMTLRIVDDD